MTGDGKMSHINTRRLVTCFPRLKKSTFRVCSPETPEYNCIGWAIGRSDLVVWPIGMSWPPTCPCEETVDAFKDAFRILGYEPCSDGRHERGFNKIALYAHGNKPKHAARQISDGKWTSKVGRSFDIEHNLEDLEGEHYGKVVMFFHRPAD